MSLSMEADDALKQQVAGYYTRKLLEYGASPQGVDWNGSESQFLRFEQLGKLLPPSANEVFSILDYGCGYGALVEFLKPRYRRFSYTGYDISEAMILKASELYPMYSFMSQESLLLPHDYVVASGIFNVKLDAPIDTWQAYVIRTLHHVDTLSIKGFAFNILTLYSDPERRKGYLYYADPCFYFDYCKKHFSRHVALLHDYGLWEFTIIVRK